VRLGDAQRDAFAEHGLLRLPGALGVGAGRGMADAIWRELEARHGVRRADPSTWKLARVTGFQALTRAGTFAGLGAPAVVDAVSDLAGEDGWRAPDHWGAPLVVFPEPDGTWDVPCQQWHLDFPARPPADELPGIRLIAPVLGGERGGEAALWSRAPQTRDRVRRFMAEGARVADVDVRVEELVAVPGDVIVLHPWTFHAPAPNCGRAPRFAVSQSLFRR